MNTRRASLALSSSILLAACTNTGLHRDQPPAVGNEDTVTVQGTFCTEDPATLEFPVKIWFILDNSNSMNVNDPNGARFSTTVALVNELAAATANDATYFGGEVFSEEGNGTFRFSQPDRFFEDPAAFAASVNAIPNETKGTPFLGALNLATSEITDDIEEDVALARRTRYVLLFLSDGAPTDSTAPQILGAVNGLDALRQRAGGLTLNTVFLGGSRPDAESLLMSMASAGGGLYKSFPNGDALDYSDFDFSAIRRTYSNRFFMLANLNALPSRDGHIADSDADGLSDEKERELGTSLSLPDTDADGCSDLMETRDAGWDPLVAGPDNGECVCELAERTADADRDGLTDCEEKWLGTSSIYPDGDEGPGNVIVGDLVPDGLDHRYLEDVSFPNDGVDYDADGVSDLGELRTHMDTHLSDSLELRDRWAYRYEIDQQDDDPHCYDFKVENVSVLPVETGPGHEENENVLLLYFAQSPQDDAQREKSFRVGRKTVKAGQGGVLEITPADFGELVDASGL